MERQEKKEKKILTENRLATISKREISLEGLASQFENGEDGIYDLISENNKSVLFKPKNNITKKDIETIPELRQCQDAIAHWKSVLAHAEGKDAYIAKTAIIDFQKDQYAIRDFIKHPMIPNMVSHSKHYTELNGYITLDENNYCVPHGVTLVDPKVNAAILSLYATLEAAAANTLGSDLWALMTDFNSLLDRALAAKPTYRTIIEGKIGGLSNAEIKEELLQQHGVTHSPEYISSIWCKKIPELLASRAEDEYLDWYFLEMAPGTYKRCSKCGQVKLAHPKYFSRNNTSKDGYYSICKVCRSKKGENK